VVSELFGRLAVEGIPYCHWKSNEHLGPATRGETDLDVLADPSDALRLSPILAESGYKRFAAPVERAHAGIEDYLACDGETGKLVHLHLHYRLVLGEKFLKGYRIPWEHVLLSGRVLDPETGVYTSSPEAELVLLAVRAALKLRTRDQLGGAHNSPALGDDVLREFRWLIDRADRSGTRDLAGELVGAEAAQALAELLESGISTQRLHRFQHAIAPALEPYRAFRPLEGRLLRWRREWAVRWNRLRRRMVQGNRALRFESPRGGVIIAFLGADGSGKSTVTSAIGSWLGWKLEVLPLYFGYGDGPVSLTRRPLRLIQRLYARGRVAGRRPDREPLGSSSNASSEAGWLAVPKAVWRALYAWSIVAEKRSRIRQAQRARHLGWVVVADRYPQSQVMALSDGPLLATWSAHRWSVLRAIADWELAAYQAMEMVAPDLVLKLHVSPAVSASRKQDGSIDALRRRTDVVRRVRFPATTRVVDIDADLPLERVLLQVKRAVWETL
jgi:thymidylate kinase